MVATEETPPRAARILFALAGLAVVFSIVIELAGGFRTEVLGVRVSARGFFRPLLVALACVLAGFWKLTPAGRDRLIDRAASAWLRVVPLLVPLAAATVLSLGLRFGTFAAGGSDPYGYVSQAELWRAGDLHVRQDFVASMPWPNADWTFTPLGYRPLDDHRLVPTYSPGVPLLMALFTIVLGACGPFLLGPACAAALVLLTYGLGRTLSGPVPAALAALAIAASPTVLFLALWPMSDVPCATFWTAALLLATRRTTWSSAGSGLAAGIAIAIRPNLAPLALGPLVIALWATGRPQADRPARRLARFAVFSVACAPFVIFIAWLFNTLYGSPLHSGYGNADSLFASGNFAANIRRYPQWLWDTQGALAFLFLLAPLIRDERAWLRRLYTGFIGAVLCAYLWYLPYEVWWFLRFLLPALPLVFVLSADVVWSGMARFGARARDLATVVFAVLLVGYSASRSQDLHVLDIGRGEQKYADAGRYIAAHVPEKAVVFSMLHSGSIRFYGHRPTLRYDVLEPEWLDRACAHLRAEGYQVFALLDDFEVPEFRKRFAGQQAAAVLDAPPIAATEGQQVQLYRFDAQAGDGAPAATARIPKTTGCE